MSERPFFAFALACAALLAIACGDRSEPAHVRSGAIEIAASVSPGKSRVGANEMRVALTDANGAPIGDAHVEVEVRMAAMGAMPAMGGPATVEPSGDGHYDAQYQLDMGGTWQITIRAHRPSGETASAEGALTVGTPGLRLEAATRATAASAPTAPEHQHSTAEPASGDANGVAARSEPKANEVDKDENVPAPSRAEGPSSVQPPHPAAFQMDPSRLRQLGIASEPAKRTDLGSTLRAAGRVTWDETALHDVTVRVAGFVGDVTADSLGAPVAKGSVLFTLYGPELYAAQREFLEASRAHAAAARTTAPDRGRALRGAAERRLALWGVDAGDIAGIARAGAPREYLPIRAPIGGYVVEKDVVAGSAVEAGQRAYRIAPLDRVWIEAEVYEAEIAELAVGTPARVELPYLPGRHFDAQVAYVYPSLQADRRTARVRFTLANPDQVLRPDMYASVSIDRPRSARLTVPDSAVLRAGEKSFVFLDLGEGRLEPRRVEIGRTDDGRVEILSGLDEGQLVVTSGTFLVSGESRLRAALESW